MKKTLFLLLASIISLPGLADITLKLPAGSDIKELNLEQGYISDMAVKGKRAAAFLTVSPDADGTITIKEMPEKPAEYALKFADNSTFVIWAAPGENISVNFESLDPIKYKISGSRLMEDYSAINETITNLVNQYGEQLKNPAENVEAIKRLQGELHTIIRDFIKTHPSSPAAPYAVLELSDDNEEFLNAYSELTPEAKESILMPYLEIWKVRAERNMAFERKMAAMQSGNVDAPGFTFKDRDGKEVSLKEFKGKWVIIDFWGSWCRWCIKGFPSLKEAYAKYKPELEIIGIACNDTPEAWLTALDKYKLDWVNLYNPEQGGGPLLEEYAVQGFPTKVIVDPEGKIRNITAGDDPEFYEVLDSLIAKAVDK